MIFNRNLSLINKLAINFQKPRKIVDIFLINYGYIYIFDQLLITFNKLSINFIYDHIIKSSWVKSIDLMLFRVTCDCHFSMLHFIKKIMWKCENIHSETPKIPPCRIFDELTNSVKPFRSWLPLKTEVKLLQIMAQICQFRPQQDVESNDLFGRIAQKHHWCPKIILKKNKKEPSIRHRAFSQRFKFL